MEGLIFGILRYICFSLCYMPVGNSLSLCFIKRSFSGTVSCCIKCDWSQRVRG